MLGASPLIVDLDGDGLSLTDPDGGVFFDLMNEGRPRKVAWTATGSRDPFVVLDRNGNGIVDNGTELFGNATDQPRPRKGEERNGFRALREYDRKALGGDGDGRISAADAIYRDLRLWFDSNKDGKTDQGELVGMRDGGVVEIDLKYKDTLHLDEFGNALKYRSRAVVLDDAYDRRRRGERRFVFDVFFRYR